MEKLFYPFMAFLSIKNLRKSFGGPNPAVNDFSLTLEDGELIAIVGPSGCGKSTLLKMVAGLETQDSGKIYMEGGQIDSWPPRRRDMAIMFQNYSLFPHLNTYHNMAFGLKMRGSGKKEIENRVREAAELLGLKELLNRFPHEMSGGERQRVALARAVVRRPRLFLLDEPLSNLDAPMRNQLRKEIRDLQTKLKTPMLYVTHDQTEALTLGDRVVVMRGGSIEQVGTPENLYHHPKTKFTAAFIGSPPMNLFPGSLAVSEGKKVFKSEEIEIDVSLCVPESRNREGGGVVLGVRPEHLRWSKEGRGDFVVTVESHEMAGPLQYVMFSAGQDRYGFLTDAEPPEIGERVWLCVNRERLHWFEG